MVAFAGFIFAARASAQEITVAPGDECLRGELGPDVAVWLREPAPPGVSVRVTVDDARRHALTLSVIRADAPVAERHLVLGRAPCQDIRTALSLAIAWPLAHWVEAPIRSGRVLVGRSFAYAWGAVVALILVVTWLNAPA